MLRWVSLYTWAWGLLSLAALAIGLIVALLHTIAQAYLFWGIALVSGIFYYFRNKQRKQLIQKNKA